MVAAAPARQLCLVAGLALTFGPAPNVGTQFQPNASSTFKQLDESFSVQYLDRSYIKVIHVGTPPRSNTPYAPPSHALDAPIALYRARCSHWTQTRTPHARSPRRTLHVRARTAVAPVPHYSRHIAGLRRHARHMGARALPLFSSGVRCERLRPPRPVKRDGALRMYHRQQGSLSPCLIGAGPLAAALRVACCASHAVVLGGDTVLDGCAACA